MDTFPKPRVVVSRCLGFEKCRYDGSVISDPTVPLLEPHVEYITVCPEKEIGLGEVDGFILKHRSPSCGLSNVKIYYGFEEKVNHFRGKGMFGEAILRSHGSLPVEDEGRLRNFSIREHFLTRLFTMATFREFKKEPTVKGLVKSCLP